MADVNLAEEQESEEGEQKKGKSSTVKIGRASCRERMSSPV